MNDTVSEQFPWNLGVHLTKVSVLDTNFTFNPIPTRGADYGHPITDCPSGIEKYLHLCLLTSFVIWIPKIGCCFSE